MTTLLPFSERLLRWFDTHGRHDLPWQHNKTAYRVWVSEIMLQQTQVETVIPYYQRFMASFPRVELLAKADTDEVLHHWTGLGYYARARNLHKCAITICEQHQGTFPSKVEKLAALPGIGPSTAAAIASIAFDQTETILDGNVKRVLTRWNATEGWPGQKKIENVLWEKARTLTPSTRNADYTQAIMDLGATLCTRSKPQCELCPVSEDCKGKKTGNPTQFPFKKPKQTKPTKHCQMLIIRNLDGEILLQKRPEQGIWGGLWSLPQIDTEEIEENTDLANDFIDQNFKCDGEPKRLETIKHVFSHYTLMITPIEYELKREPSVVTENQAQLWYNLDAPAKLGLAAPVKKLLHG